MFDRVDTDAAPPAPAPRAPRSAIGWFGAALMAALALVACGGGGDGGVGSNGTGISMGTVNGFGSVIVDGVRYRDSSARVEVEGGASGNVFSAAQVKLGHRTRIESTGSPDDTANSNGVAQRIELEPTLIGLVDNKVGSAFFVLGQSVVVNDTPGTQPVTVYDGYTGVSQVVAGDWVEVHAIRQLSGSSVTYLATRVEKKTVVPGYLRVAGVASNSASGSFKLGSLTVQRSGATILPAGATVADSASVVVFASTGAYTVGTTTLSAGAVRVRALETAVSATAYLSGVVVNLDPNKSLEIDGVAVDLTGLSASDYDLHGAAALANDDYVRVKGRFLPSGGFRASKVQVRKSDDDVNNAAELRGTVFGYVAPNLTTSTPGSFTVRDTAVLQPVSVVATGCPSAGIVSGSTFVEIKGRVSAAGVTATSIKCEDEAEVPDAVVTRTGTLGNYSQPGKSFTLQVTDGVPVTLNVVYTTTTVFVQRGDVLSATQGEALLASGNGSAFEVEGMLSGTALTAQKIKLESSP